MTHRTGTGFTRRSVVGAALLLALGACSTSADQGEPADGVYLARAGEVMIAVVAVDDLVTVYACDGRAEGVTVNTWFHGQLENGVGTVSGDGGATVDLVVGANLSGELHFAEGESTSFTGAASEGDSAGLYWGEQGDWLGGWILDDAGDQRGAVLKRNTGDVAFITLPPGLNQVTLPDQTIMGVSLMLAPKDVT